MDLPQANNDREELQVDCSATVDPTARHNSAGGGGGGGGARYKLMSPAMLPISRSTTNITIPSGLSPTSFLESPVFISNIKVNQQQLLSLSCGKLSAFLITLVVSIEKIRFSDCIFGKLGLNLELDSVSFLSIQKKKITLFGFLVASVRIRTIVSCS